MSAKKIVFAVDDEMSMLEIYQEILGDEYDLHCFELPQDLLAKATILEPHLVIIDIGLTGMNGYQLCEALQGMANIHHVPVVFVTGRPISQDQGQAFFSGGSEYVTKPIQATSFCALLKRMIEDHYDDYLNVK